jgi:hypothetical protein
MTGSGTRQVAGDGPRLPRRDWAVIIIGALVLIASFLPWEVASTTTALGAYSGSDSAWNAGFAAWFGSLLCAAAAAAVAARRWGYSLGIRGAGPNLIVGGLAAAGTVLLVIRLLTLPRGGSYGIFGAAAGYGYGPGLGAYTGVGLAVIQTIIEALSLRASGERLPSLAAAASQRPGGAAPDASAHQPGPAAAPVPPAPQQQDQELVQRLSRLDDLRGRGMISDSEYAEQRRHIIRQL